MSLNRYAKRRDENEKEIVDALRACGVWVTLLDKPTDLLCWRKEFFLIEVKNPDNTHLEKKTPGQIRFHQTANELGAAVYEVETIKEALECPPCQGSMSTKN
jgi:hypothetical protein